MHSVTNLILVLHLLPRAIVGIDLTCESVNPLIPSDVECVCKNAPGTDIDWLIDDGFNSNCVLSSICAPQYSGYRYSMNMTENVYKMTINSYNYSDCTKIACKDPSDGSIMQSMVPSAIIFDTTFPTSMSEPGLNNSNGTISVTTGCISGFSDVHFIWYILVDGLEEIFNTTFIKKIDNSSCVDCGTDVNGQITIRFEHNEAPGLGTKTGRFKVFLYHVPTKFQLNLTSRYYYTVKDELKGNKQTEYDGDALYLCFGIVPLIILLVMIIVRCNYIRPKFTKIELKDTKIHLEWTDRLDCYFCQLIFGYNIVHNQINRQVTDKICRKHSTKKKYYTLENLDPMAIYEISLSRTLCCFKSSATQIYVITRKNGIQNDQGYYAKPTRIDVRWTQPDCITNPRLYYQVKCNEVENENTDRTKSTITSLMPSTTYKIEVFAIDNGTNSLLFAEEITTTPLQVNLEYVCNKPAQSCVECNIKWTVEDIDIHEHSKESNIFYFNVTCYSEEKVVHKKEKIRVSSYTIPELYPNRSYSVYVYPVYHSVTFKPAMIELTIPDKPTNLKAAAKSTEIVLRWTKPDHTGKQQLQYLVTCNEIKYENTKKASRKIEDLVPGQKHKIKIFTILNGIKSLPLEEEVWTPPLKVSIEDVWYEPGISCVECNITWKLKDFDPPETWNESDHLVFKIICDPVNKHMQADKKFRYQSYSKQLKLKLSLDCLYFIKVYAFYHAVRLEPPGVIELQTPCQQVPLPEIQ